MIKNGVSDSISNPKRKIGDIQTEYSQIVRVLAEPLPQPSDSVDVQEKRKLAAAREQQLQERQRFILRYQTAIKAFLGKKLRNTEKVEDVWDFFLQKCLEGKLKKYDPKEGTFRKYLKVVLRRTCYEYARKNADNDALVQMESVMGPAVDANDVVADQAFNKKLIDSIFRRALQSIQHVDNLYYVSLKLTTEAIDKGIKPPSSQDLASILSAESGKAVSRDNARTIKSRASKQFAKQIIAEVSELIGTPDLDEVENALVDIGILQFCKKALSKMREKKAKKDKG